MIQTNPTILVIFGATGDLMKKKIVPALFSLFLKQKLPPLFCVMGVSRRSLSTNSFREYVKDLLLHSHLQEHTKHIDSFISHFQFQKADFLHPEGYGALAKTLEGVEANWKVKANTLFYLAIPPQFYESVFIQLAKSGLAKALSSHAGWTRVLVEKPFGSDVKTAQHLDELLGSLFQEEQIYRIDHYLAKEMLQNILMFRFSNNLLESAWNNAHIEKIELRLLESIDVKGRGIFYDQVGALRDVGQNHLLQMLALVTMDNPHVFDPHIIHDKRAEIISYLKPLTANEIKSHTIRGQYEGYQEVEHVKKNSKTETYFHVQFELDHPRWRGVPIIMESGKAFPEARKEIVITFSNPSSLLCPVGKNGCKNKVIISLEPEEEIKMTLWSKVPGLDLQLQEKTMSFIYRPKGKRIQYVEEYEKLLLDAIEGNQLLFATTKEIASMWKFIDLIITGWEKYKMPLLTYKQKSWDITHKDEMQLKTVKTIENKKEIGIVGLGKIGGNIARRLLEKNWRVIGYNRSPEDTQELEKEQLTGIYELSEIQKKLSRHRVVWITVPAGTTVNEILFGKKGLVTFLQKGDIIVDGGNSFYKDSIERAKKLAKYGIHFVDVGFSGGPGGARNGGSLMVGGEKKDFDYLHPVFIDMAVPQGVMFFHGHGAGHFIKMIHNGIEYGMMQAIAEGFTILKKSSFKLDLTKVAEIYNHGSVIESKLVGWLREGLRKYGQELETISGTVTHTGEGMWTVNAAKELHIKIPVIADSFQFRIDSQKHPSYMGKILSTLRNQFGGHSAK